MDFEKTNDMKKFLPLNKLTQTLLFSLLFALIGITNVQGQSFDGDYCPQPGEPGDEYGPASGAFSITVNSSVSGTCAIEEIHALVFEDRLRLAYKIGNAGTALFRIYVDADNNPSTGLQTDNFGGANVVVAGAEFVFQINSHSGASKLYEFDTASGSLEETTGGFSGLIGDSDGCDLKKGDGQFLEFNIPFQDINFDPCGVDKPGRIIVAQYAAVAGGSETSNLCSAEPLSLGVELRGDITGSNGTYCVGNNETVTLTLTGEYDEIVRWEYKEGFAGTWMPISNTTPSQTVETSTLNLGDTYFRAIIKSNVCPNEYISSEEVITLQQCCTLASASASASTITCNGGESVVTISANGGNAPLTFSLQGFTAQTNNGIFNNVPAGTYNWSVSETGASCTPISGSIIISEPTAIVVSATPTAASCNGDNGTAGLSATGGDGSYTFTSTGGTVTGNTLTAPSGTYTITATDGNGCTGTTTVTINEPEVLAASAIQDSPVVCNGESNGAATVTATGGNAPYSYSWDNGETTATASALDAGLHSVTVTDAKGCSATATMTINEPEVLTGIDVQTACDSYTWIDGIEYTESNNIANYTLTNANGCDSVVTLNLTINKSTESYEEITACDSYRWNGNTYTESGTYSENFMNIAGCDSTANLVLTISKSTEQSIERTACEEITINGISYTESGTHTQYLQNENGCNLKINIDLTILNSTSSEEEITACDSYIWNDIKYTESGIYTANFTNHLGCDSVATLILTINNSTESFEEVATCDSYTWNGVEYSESGTYSVNLTNETGCDSIANLILTINKSTESVEEITACESYIWNNQEYTESGTYSATFTNEMGCDSTANLVLTINQPSESVEEVVTCESYIWNNSEYKESGTYTLNLVNENGCDSIATLILSINVPTESVEEITACNSYIWNNVEYTESGEYTINLTNAEGCDSTAILSLDINKSIESLEEVTTCNSYLWNDNEYTESGIYTINFTGENGCDSIAHLNLTINNTIESIEEVSACESYIWNDIEYTESGTYTSTHTGANGCDSVSTLSLTINNIQEYVTEITACGSYIWYNFEYTESGTYSTTFSRVLGCDSIEVLELTIVDFTEQTITESGCDKVIVNDVTYTESGTFTQKLVNHMGCDSVLTINVTITNCSPEIRLEDDRHTINMNTPVTANIKENDKGITDGSQILLPPNTSSGGTITVNEDGTVTYTPPTDYIGKDTFDYVITTPAGLTDTATVIITIIAPVDMVIDAIADEFEIFNYETANGNILENDYNPVGEKVINTIPLVQPLNGSVIIDNDGSIIYTPDAGFSGIDSFTYQVCNSILPTLCSEAVVTIYVIEEEDDDPDPFSTCEIFIPDGFSPNGDNVNEYFEITYYSDQGNCEAFGDKHPEARVEIYNRWGNLVWEKDGFGNIDRWGLDQAWWDGSSTHGMTIGKDKMTPGTYFYVLNFNDNNREPVSGTIFLNR